MFADVGVDYRGGGIDAPLPRPSVCTGGLAMNEYRIRELEAQKPEFQKRYEEAQRQVVWMLIGAGALVVIPLCILIDFLAGLL